MRQKEQLRQDEGLGDADLWRRRRARWLQAQVLEELLSSGAWATGSLVRRRRGKVAPARGMACWAVGAGAMAGGQGSGQGVRGNGKLLLCVQVLGGGRGKRGSE